MADKKEMEREIAHFEKVASEWDHKAELAIDKGRDDLARGALQAKQKANSEIEARKAGLEAAEDAFTKRSDDLVKLQAKLDEAKAKHRALMMRRQTAEHRIKARSRTYDSRVDDALARYSAVERKVDEMEAYADTIKGHEPTLEQEFADLERSDSVEKELEELKRRKGVTPGATSTPATRPDTDQEA